MGRANSPQELWRCIEAFAVWTGLQPQTYSTGQEVMGDDPILATHRSYFEPAAERVITSRPRPGIETATAAPGERRSSVAPHTEGAPT